jgi:tetratricopeptide (TPR) repeat protein
MQLESDRALALLSRGIRNDPAVPRHIYQYAPALFQRGPGPEVRQSLLEAIRLDPAYGDAYYLLSRYYQKTGEPQLVVEALAKFTELKNHPVGQQKLERPRNVLAAK